jgi:hypothetical protein
MSIHAERAASDAIKPDSIETRPYPPSFIDKFLSWVEHLPIPFGVTYFALFLLEGSLNHLLSWADGWLPSYTLNPLILTYPLWLWGPLAIMTYLNLLAREVWHDFASLLDVSSETKQRIEYEFTTMPQKAVILSGAFWAIWYFGVMVVLKDNFFRAYRLGDWLTVFLFMEGLITFLIGSVIYYHSIRQLRLVDQTVKLVKQFDLFRLDPVYAFSILTSRTGIAWVCLISFTLLTFPIQIALLPTLATLVIQIVLAITAFVLPLRSVNRRLVVEKRRLLAEHSQRVQSTLARLHAHLNENRLTEMVELNNAIAGLKAEGELLTNIPTWPWRAGLFTGFLSIVVLPIVLFIVQLVIGRWLGR